VIYLAHQSGCYSMKDIADYFGLHYSSISKILKNVENSRFNLTCAWRNVNFPIISECCLLLPAPENTTLGQYERCYLLTFSPAHCPGQADQTRSTHPKAPKVPPQCTRSQSGRESKGSSGRACSGIWREEIRNIWGRSKNSLFVGQIDRQLQTDIRLSANRGLALGSDKFKDEIEKLGDRRQRLLKRGPKKKA